MSNHRGGNLPLDLTSFVGRRRETADVGRALATARLVTLTGVGGVGKTRLALRVAGDRQHASAEEVWLVELDQLDDPALLEQTVVTTLDLRNHSSAPLATLLEHLAARPTLLVLDSCEHVIDAVAKLAATLLRSCAGLRILATSRQPLNIRGETTFSVPPLAIPDPDQPTGPLHDYDAVALFTQRAEVALPGFALTAGNQDAVAEICGRLDGIPLAIELATARLATLSVAEISRRLTNRYQLLTVGWRCAPTRQQTLRACVEWSYDLCTAAERLLWQRMSVFTGGFELDVAEGVCADDDLSADDVLDLVASLVTKSVLIRDERDTIVRYRLLDTIRDYGAEKLAAETVVLRRKHRDWYEQLTRDAEQHQLDARQVDWHARLRRELPNLRVALEFCLTEPGEIGPGFAIATALYPFWLRGRVREGWQWFDRALAAPGQAPIEALYAAAVLAGFQGELTRTSALVGEIAERQDDAASPALATMAAAILAAFSRDVAGAAAGFRAAADLHRAAGNLTGLVEALIGRATFSGLLGDQAEALACHEEVLAITQPRGEVWHQAHSLRSLGVALWRRGDIERACDQLRQSLRLSRLMDERLNIVWCLDLMGCLGAGGGDPRRAAALLGAADSLSASVGTSTAALPDLVAHHDQCEQRIRQALGEQAFQAAFEHGQSLSLDDAVGYALNEKTPAVRHGLADKLDVQQHLPEIGQHEFRSESEKVVRVQRWMVFAATTGERDYPAPALHRRHAERPRQSRTGGHGDVLDVHLDRRSQPHDRAGVLDPNR